MTQDIVTRSWGPALVVLCLAACTGNIDSSPVTAGDLARPSGTGGSAGAGAASDTAGAGPAAPQSDFTTSAELRRLTRVEYTNTVFDLLGVDLSAEDRPKELLVQGHSEIAGAQKIGYEDTSQYLGLADKVATAAAAKIDADMKCVDAACGRAWTEAFLLRAFREPPTPTIIDRYAAILGAADAGGTSVERVTALLAAVLTSPHFLYRKELGAAVVSGNPGVRTLNAYQVASRLSYLVWQSMPDAQLFAAADKRTLLDPATRKVELERMLKDKRAQNGLRAFVADWMGLFDNNLGKKSATVLMGTPPDLPQQAARSFDLLVDDVLTTRTPSRFSDLLKTNQIYANAALATVLGVNAAGSALQKVTLPAGDRLGILTHPMVIGAHSKESGASPFPIGKFIYENLLCEVIPPPPASVPKIDDSAAAVTTLRQKLESLTKDQPCASCHVRIGPPGFAFLPFDPIGRFKNSDARGQAYDTAGVLVLGGVAAVPFSGAADLSAKLAARPEALGCISRRMFRWAYGRFEAGADTAALSAVENAAVTTGAGVVEILQQIVADPAFAQMRGR